MSALSQRFHDKSMPSRQFLAFLLTFFQSFTYCQISSVNCDKIYISAVNGTDPLPLHFINRSSSKPLGMALENGGVANAKFADLGQLRYFLRQVANGSKSSFSVLVLGGSLTAGHFPWFLDENSDPQHGTAYSNKNLACASMCRTASMNVGGNVIRWDGDFGQGECKACAWPSRFRDWLERAYPAVAVTVENWAIGATDSESILGLLGSNIMNLANFDVIIVSYSDNDWETAFRVGAHHMGAAFEELIRMLLSLPKSPHCAIIIYEIYVLDSPGDFIFPPHKRVANHYGIPVISYDASAMPTEQLEQLPPPPTGISADGSWSPFIFRDRHPPWPYHQLISDLLCYFISEQVDEVCNSIPADIAKMATEFEEFSPGHHGNKRINDSLPLRKLPSPIPEFADIRTQLFHSCFSPLTLIRGVDNSSDIMFTTSAGFLSPRVNSPAQQNFNPSDGNDAAHATHNWGGQNYKWRYGEDLPGNRKFGWWIDNPHGGRISFRVKIAAKPTAKSKQLSSRTECEHHVITFGFLESYEHMGSVALYLDDDFNTSTVTYNALNVARKSSRMKVVTICLDFSLSEKVQLGAKRVKVPEFVEIPHLTKSCNSTCSRIRQFPQKHTEHTLHIELLPISQFAPAIRNKFKIIFITTC